MLALANLLLLDDQLADEYFYDKTTALSPAFIALLTIAVTAGVGSLLSTAVPSLTTTGVAGGTLSTAGQVTAAFASSAIVGSTNGVVSGDFDLGDILKNAAFAAATSYLAQSINLKAAGDPAGATGKAIKAKELTGVAKALDKKFSVLGGSWGKGFNKGIFSNNATAQLTAANVLEGAFDGAINAGLSSAVYGTDFKAGLRNSVVRNIVALGLADAQTKIGGIFNDAQGNPINGGEGSFGHIALHAIAGCAAAEATGADCGAGAVGGITQAIYAGSLNGSSLTAEQQRRRISLISAVTGYVFSGGKAENVSIANTIGVSGFENNYLFHQEAQRKAELEDQLTACSTSGNCATEDITNIERELGQINALDQARDLVTRTACLNIMSSSCSTALGELQDAIDTYLGPPDGFTRLWDENKSAGLLRDSLLSGPAWDPAAFGLGLAGGAALGLNGVLGAATVREAARFCASEPICTAAIVGQLIGVELITAYSGDMVVVTALDGTVISRIDFTPPSITAPNRTTLIYDVARGGTKITPENVVDIRKLVDGRIVWLETGTATGLKPAGLAHIIADHGTDFANKGITQSEIPDALFTALSNGTIVGHQGSGTGRPIYVYTFNGQTHRVAITVGDNGFIVGANPTSVP